MTLFFLFCSKPKSPDPFFEPDKQERKRNTSFLTRIISSYSLLFIFFFKKTKPALGKITILIYPWSFHVSFSRHSPCVLSIINSVSCQLMPPEFPLSHAHTLPLAPTLSLSHVPYRTGDFTSCAPLCIRIQSIQRQLVISFP